MNRKQHGLIVLLALVAGLIGGMVSNQFLIVRPVFAQKGKTIPITPFEVMRRMKDVPKILEWSMKKHLTVSGPEFWGIHHIYIDNTLKHAIFCLKADLTTHVFIGNPCGAVTWRKYDRNVKLLFSKALDNDTLQWKIYKDIVLYKGRMLPTKEIPEEPFWGEVLKVETFNDDINDQWIFTKINDLYNE